ncbi:MAG: ribosome biogenesis GTP-binding protein YsxC [Halobacteriovoraceae bacterium]|nr:ribosome biogenesis GTP-binding protein YsxC [Halobacteriovoraceae bacterium]|tara:strand:- start:104295 stop:104942 length:648 start_codon:yes stop_codon:yes gene_type:complete
MQNELLTRGSAKFLRAYDKPEDIIKWFEANPAPGLAMAGRSNVGKSSLINALFGPKTARTSKTPGRTQKINIFSFEVKGEDEEVQKFYLYDLPGYGFAQVSKSMLRNWQELMTSFFLNLNDQTLVLNIQDARHPNQKSDLSFYEFIDPKYVDIFLAFNKIDKLKKQKEKAALKNLKAKIYEQYKAVKQIHFISAEKRTGCPELEYAIGSYLLSKV